MARHESSRPSPGQVTMRHSAGPAGPIIASQSGGGSSGRGPMDKGPLAWRWEKAARRLEPQSPPATAVW
eukprot:11321319-Alexandrium_andersonii.AAC.1